MNKKLICRICNYQTNTSHNPYGELWEHWKSHNKEELNNNGYKICEICGEIRDGSGGLMTHVWRAHKITKFEYAKKFNIKGYVDICKFCGKEYQLQKPIVLVNRQKNKIPSNCGREKCAKEAQHEAYENRTGYKHPMQNPEVKEKWNKIQIKKWGGLSWLCDKNKREEYYQENLSKYGYKMPLCSNKSHEKSKQLLIEKYGVDNPINVPGAREKKENTINKIGRTEYYKKIIKNIEQTSLQRYGATNAMKNSTIKQKSIDNQNFKPEFNRSKTENKFKEILDKLGIEHKIRKIFGNYVDFCIELENNHKLIIMIDGEYWHNLNGNPQKKPLKTIYEAKGDRDFGRLAKFLKDKLFNLQCYEDRNVTLLRFKTSDIEKFAEEGGVFGFYHTCGDINIVYDFMQKINLNT